MTEKSNDTISKYYHIYLDCENCYWSFEYKIEKGKRVSEIRCQHCGVKALKAQRQ